MPSNAKSLDVILLVTAVLCIGALITSTIRSTIISQQEKISNNTFANQVDTAADQIEGAIEKYSTLVVAAQALFHASENVSRQEFLIFSESLSFQKTYPYMQGLSWNAAVDSKDTTAFERSVQRDTSISVDGFPEFKVRPETNETTRYVITYIEPMQGNEGAFGFDIGSNIDRRKTVELARDTGDVAATAPITLAQESGDQKGFLMMLPVFEKDANGKIFREAATFKGVVVAVFRIGDLISNASDLSFESMQVFDITDGKRGQQSEPIFQHGDKAGTADEPVLIRTIDVANRQWELVYAKPAFKPSDNFGNRAFTVLGGMISLLSAIFIGYIVTSRQRVNRLAKLLTVDLENTNKELERSNEDLAQFAFVASHDLQTPVRNIRMSVELLEEEMKDIPSNPDVTEYLDILRKSSDRMKALIVDLLDYANTGDGEINKTKLDLNELLDGVKQDTVDLRKEKNVSLVIKGKATIHVNRQQMERVFINLIENSTKYSHKDRSPIIEIESMYSDNTVKIRFKDNGIGIKNKFHDTIFTAFRRLHRQNEIVGTGLGLSICRKILQRHRGSISVESSNDQGTVFLIMLPVT